MQAALNAFQKAEVHLRQIVVQHARCDACLVHLKGQHDEVEHQPHVIGDLLRQFIRGSGQIGSRQRWTPAFEAFFLGRSVDPLFDASD